VPPFFIAVSVFTELQFPKTENSSLILYQNSRLFHSKILILTLDEIDTVISTEAYTTLEIEVPKGCLEAYQTAPVWNKFWYFKEGDYEGQSAWLM